MSVEDEYLICLINAALSFYKTFDFVIVPPVEHDDEKKLEALEPQKSKTFPTYHLPSTARKSC